MNRKFYFSFLAFVLTLTATVAFVIGHSNGAKAASANAALNALPASDFVVVVDAQRAFNETLPAMLVGNPTLLAKINTQLDDFEKKTGINPRSIESVAIGGRINSSRPNGEHVVVIVNGSFKSDELLNAAFTAAEAKGEKFQKEEQQYEGKTIFLIGPQKALKNVAEVSKTSPPATLHAETGTDKMAVTALDSNTLAVGNLESVRAAIDASLGRNRVDTELVQLAMQTPSAVVSFSGRIPQSMIEKSNSHGDDNPFAKYVASIREFYGSFSVNGAEAETVVNLRTENAEQASDISQAINSLKSLATLGISQSTGNNAGPHDAFVAVLNGLSVTAQGNEVRIDARIPQAILAPFMHMH